MEPSNTKMSRLRRVQMVQNFHVVWLCDSINEDDNDKHHNSIVKLREVVNTVNIFNTVDECVDFITDMTEETTFMIVSETYGQSIIPVIQDIRQVNGVYIFCEYKSLHEQWTKPWSKVKGIFTDITLICKALKQAVEICDKNMVSMSFVKPNDEILKKNLDELDQSFMYTQLLKEILMTIDFDQKHFKEFLTYCREQFAGNAVELGNVDKLGKEYHKHQPIWWYTCNSFLHSMLNRALRVMDVDLIIKIGFFIQDLDHHIVALHSEQYSQHNQMDSFTVYRGQGLSETDFNQLMQSKGGLLSFNNFLSTSLDKQVSLAYAESNQSNPDMIGVFFQMTVDPKICSTSFANVHRVSHYQEEEEILFSMHSVFRIEELKQIGASDRLWQVNLTLTCDSDSQLHALTKCLSNDIIGSTGWYRLGDLMLRLGHFNKAEELYETLLKQTNSKDDQAAIYNYLGRIREQQGKYTEAATIFEKSLEIMKKTLPPNHPHLGTSYNNIGMVYDKIGKYSEAVLSHEKALEIMKKTLPPNHLHLATSYHNLGSLYERIGKYSEALVSHEKAVDIRQKNLPSNHPQLAISYSNIAWVYESMGKYSEALLSHEKALAIGQKILPPNHPHLGTFYNNIATVYQNMGKCSEALLYQEKSLEIFKKTLPSNHPYLAASYANIGLMYSKMGKYSKALLFYEDALEILKKTLPPNHPNLATIYNNIGGAYENMDKYSEALLSHEKALEIMKKTLPPNHFLFGVSYNNIGMVYNKMGKYSKALLSHENALEIMKKSLPPNHPDLATSNSNIGLIYYRTGEYSKAVLYLERAVNIAQCSFSSNHPVLQSCLENLNLARRKL